MTVASIDEAFLAQVEPLRRELTAHCYRMTGSIHDAEDLVQETYLRAWRAFHGFEGRASVRTWMYQIATNTCLTALQGKERRPLPTGLGQASADPVATLEVRNEISWLEPLPDAMVWGGDPTDPATVVVSRESVRLAYIAALQHLTAQQRAVIILRDVLAWRANEVAEVLGVSVASVNSSLQRARAHLAKVDPPTRAEVATGDERSRRLVEEFAAAFERYDVGRVVELLTEDAVWEMPPFTGWYAGPADIAELISTQCPAQGPGDMRILPSSANGQPVLAVYMRDGDGVHRAFQLQQLTLSDGRVSHVTCYFDLALFEAFGLPSVLSA
ncbi:sigma-70 family RNA polymerase sigma factor [Nakamurella silvestris]|nr:sigma-70 family RNA polymerase sigma factor [Nakamurella silvestris]